MRTKKEIEEKIENLERNAERYYNIGTPMAQNTANNLLSMVDLLKWVLEE